jgi:hypothetical protein
MARKKEEYLTAGDLKKLLADVPDDAVIVQGLDRILLKSNIITHRSGRPYVVEQAEIYEPGSDEPTQVDRVVHLLSERFYLD